MNTFENVATRKETGYISPEKLAMLKRVYLATCEEANIPIEAKAQRHELAERLMAAGGIVDDEEVLLSFAQKAVADLRR